MICEEKPRIYFWKKIRFRFGKLFHTLHLLHFLNLCSFRQFYDIRILHLSWPRRTKDFPMLVKNLPDHSKSLVKFMNYLLKVSSFYQSNLRLHFIIVDFCAAVLSNYQMTWVILKSNFLSPEFIFSVNFLMASTLSHFCEISSTIVSGESFLIEHLNLLECV